MTPLIEFARVCLVCLVEHERRIPKWFAENRRCVLLGSLIIFDITGEESVTEAMRMLAADSLPRLMDHFYLWTPAGARETRQQILDALFNETATNFGLLINEENNRRNIKSLLVLIQKHFKGRNDLSVLDFGCGPGLSIDVAGEFPFKLTGYDRCEKMRAIAHKRGLAVLTPDIFYAGSRAYDAILASYVLHLTLPSDELKQLWSVLKPGGILVANFHKSSGLSITNEFLTGLGATTTILPFTEDSNQDPFCTYERPS
jgi:ubiquinone/menaquinone biosynthesis C-methylase UbiE